jgi:hypothetical protein
MLSELKFIVSNNSCEQKNRNKMLKKHVKQDKLKNGEKKCAYCESFNIKKIQNNK